LAERAEDQETKARHFNNLAAVLSALGRREEALTAAQEAADLYRGLARARPEVFTPDLAMSLNNLANVLLELGRREAALTAAQEAADLHRALARGRGPRRSRPIWPCRSTTSATCCGRLGGARRP
jgi:tetratricopeptide (TPR) repeat protein